jgi:hypothetical protein
VGCLFVLKINCVLGCMCVLEFLLCLYGFFVGCCVCVVVVL